MIKIYGNAELFFCYREGRVFQFQVYKRMFTPYEQDEKYSDESVYEDGSYVNDGIIREAVNLGNGDWLLGIETVFDGEPLGEGSANLAYYRLSEIRLMYSPEAERIIRNAGDGNDE